MNHYALCIDNADYAASLERLKLYRILPDPEAERDDLLRVVDESGEDYLYEKSMFLPLDLPVAVRKAVEEVDSLRRAS